jgi:colicin import membrane protein
MPIECTDRSKALVLTSLVLAAALAAISIQPVMAQGNVHNASTWGAMFTSQVEKCWKKPTLVGDEATNIKVVIEIRPTREGRLVGEPLVSSESSPTASDFSKAYQKNALRAITECQPYTLPAKYYEEWKYFMSVFLPSPVPLKENGKPAAGLFDTRTPSICRGC